MSKMKLTPLASAIFARRWPYALASLIAPGLALAGPSGGTVVAGQAAINAAGNTTTIQQGSASAVINWQDFSVGSSEYVIFNQPSASAAVLNKVVGGSPSEILGNLQANGRVFIVNPQGVLFGQGSQVNVGSLVATTMNIADSDFMQGRYVLQNAGNGAVSNLGQISAAQNGYVVLAGNHVQNEGVIAAQLGEVVLASGNAVTLDINGSGLVNISVDQASLAAQAGVSNLGEIAAQGGRVLMTARTARGLAQAAVNNSGTIRAGGIVEKGGDIYLLAQGGDIVNDGLLDASGSAALDGGNVMIHSDADIELAAGSRIDITGRNGGAARIVAQQHLGTQAGSLIDGRPQDAAGKGGFTELSGHGSMTLDGSTLLGQGGTLLLDPHSLCIGVDSYGGCGGSFDTVVREQDIESSLNNGTDVYVVASSRITVAGNLVGNSIDSDSTSTSALILGIGFVDTFSGQQSGGFGASPLQGFSGIFRNSAALSFGDGGVIFENGAGINIGGDLYIKGATDRGDVSVGNIAARSVDVRGVGTVSLGDVLSREFDLAVSSKSAISTGNLTATLGRVVLRVLHSDTASSVGNITANGDYGGICINNEDCDFEYSGFAGFDPGYAGYGNVTPAEFDLGTTARTWSAKSILINNVDIGGSALTLDAQSPTEFGIAVGLYDNLDIGTDTLTITTDNFLSYQEGGNSTKISAGTLNVTARNIYLTGVEFSGTRATIVQDELQSFTGIFGSSFNYSESLTISAIGSFNVQDTQINSGLQFQSPSAITGHNVSISADDLFLGAVDITAGVLNLNALGGELQISGGGTGSNLNFNTGTLTAIAGEFTPPVLALTEVTQTETEAGFDTFNGAVFIGDYSEAPNSDSVQFNYASATLNADGIAFIDNSSFSGGALTVNSDTYHVSASQLTGTSASFNSTGEVLEAAAQGDYYNPFIGSSTFNYTGALTANSTRALTVSDVTINANAGQNVAGRSLSLSAAELQLSDVSARAQTISLDAAGNGNLGLSQVLFNVPAGQTLPPLPTNSSLSLSGGVVTVDAMQAHARTITMAATRSSAPFETPVGASIVNSTLRFTTLAGTSANLFDITDSMLSGASITLSANGVPRIGTQNQMPLFDATASVIGNTIIDLTGSFTLTSSDGIEFFGRGGETATNSITAQSITLDAGTAIGISNTVFTAVNGSFSADGPRSDDPTGPAIAASSSGFGFSGLLAFNADGQVHFNDVFILDFSQSGIPSSTALSVKASDDIRLTNSTVRVANTYFETNNSLISYGGEITGASQLTLLAGSTNSSLGKATQSGADILDLGGTISGGNTLLIGAGGVERNGSLSISSRALDVAGEYINLSGSSIIVGNGVVTAGDTTLLQSIGTTDSQLPRPQSSGPNARFRAGSNAASTVTLGTLTFSQAGGDHLFVRGANFDFAELSYTERLFLQFTPTDVNQSVSLADIGLDGAPTGLTVAIGSSSYLGNITVASAENPLQFENGINFVLASRGEISGLEFLSTNGRVVVVNGASSDPAVSDTLNQVSNISTSTPGSGAGSSGSGEAEGDGEEESGSGGSSGGGSDDTSGITVDEGGGAEQGNEFECT